MIPSDSNRLFFVDWLRIFALGVLWWYHSGLIFAEKMSFHIKSPTFISYLDEILFFFHEWRLALLFFISGVASYYIEQKTGNQFLNERWKRLLIPLIFGILVLVPPQIYIERIFNGFEYESYAHFYIQSFQNGFYPHGDISWHHLWFIAYLLCYVSIFTLVKYLVVYFSNKFRNFLQKKSLSIRVSYLSILWLGAIPLIIIEVILKPYSSGIQNIIQDLAKFSYYFLIFCYGFSFAVRPIIWNKIQTQKYTFLVAALIGYVVIYPIRWSGLGLQNEILFPYYTAIRAANTWFCILALLGFGASYLHFQHVWLPSLNKAVLPFYMLHQTAIMMVSYWLIQYPLHPFLNWILTVGFSFMLCYLVYVYLILPFKKLGFLFGLHHRKERIIQTG